MYWLYQLSGILLIPAVIMGIYAQIKVKTSFKKYSTVYNRRGLRACDVAREILDRNGLNYVTVQPTPGELTDHFDPEQNIVKLSDSVYNSTSVAAIGVAAHEVGHAIQHAKGYIPIKIRSDMVPVTNFGSRISTYLVILGIIIISASQAASGQDTGMKIAIAGALLFSTVAIFQLVTLPVEFNASRRALSTLRQYSILDEFEIQSARKVLSAAAMTYVAALAASLLQLLRLFIIIAGASNNRRRR